jgi:hypothetical protein
VENQRLSGRHPDLDRRGVGTAADPSHRRQVSPVGSLVRAQNSVTRGLASTQVRLERARHAMGVVGENPGDSDSGESTRQA